MNWPRIFTVVDLATKKTELMCAENTLPLIVGILYQQVLARRGARSMAAIGPTGLRRQNHPATSAHNPISGPQPIRDRQHFGRRRPRPLIEVLRLRSDVDLFGDLNSVVDLNSEVANGALNS